VAKATARHRFRTDNDFRGLGHLPCAQSACAALSRRSPKRVRPFGGKLARSGAAGLFGHHSDGSYRAAGKPALRRQLGSIRFLLSLCSFVAMRLGYFTQMSGCVMAMCSGGLPRSPDRRGVSAIGEIFRLVKGEAGEEQAGLAHGPAVPTPAHPACAPRGFWSAQLRIHGTPPPGGWCVRPASCNATGHGPWWTAPGTSVTILSN